MLVGENRLPVKMDTAVVRHQTCNAVEWNLGNCGLCVLVEAGRDARVARAKTRPAVLGDARREITLNPACYYPSRMGVVVKVSRVGALNPHPCQQETADIQTKASRLGQGGRHDAQR